MSDPWHVIARFSTMLSMSWLIQRRLRATSRQLQSARADLAVLDEQIGSLVDDALDLETRAVVADTGHAAYEHRQAMGHVEAINNERQRLTRRIADIEASQDQLLDGLNRSSARRM